MKVCFLKDFTTGEVYTTTGAYGMQYLYKRANSIRRKNRSYNLMQSNMELGAMECVNYYPTPEEWQNCKIVEQWQGELNTPIMDLNIGVREYHALTRMGITTIGEFIAIGNYTKFFKRAGRQVSHNMGMIIYVYDRDSGRNYIRQFNNFYRKGE